MPSPCESRHQGERRARKCLRAFYFAFSPLWKPLTCAVCETETLVPLAHGENTKGKTVLYVIGQEKIDSKKITADIVKTVRPQNAEARISPSTATYSISDIIPFVNTEDLLRYLPDDMLTDSQKDIKWEGIAKTIKYTNGNHPLRGMFCGDASPPRARGEYQGYSF